MTRREASPLQLSCTGCGAVQALDYGSPLVPSVRPFVEEHRSCPAAAEDDREMRTAYARRR